MASLRRFALRLLAVLRRRRAEEELAREIGSHLTILEDEYRRRGLSPQEAKLAARRAFGGAERTKDLHRDARSIVWLEDLRRDVHHAFRSLQRTPAFTAVAVLTLALGIGANTAVFSVVNALLLTPLPFSDSDRFVRVIASPPPVGTSTVRPRVAVTLDGPELAELRARVRTLSHVGVAGRSLLTWSGPGQTVRWEGAVVSTAFLPILKALPLHGRLLTAADETAASDRVVVLAHRTWRLYFGGDPGVVGKTITLTPTVGPPGFRVPAVYTVVGVMQEPFEFPDRRTEFWVPFRPGPVRSFLVGRLADGVSREAAEAEVVPILRAIRKDQLPAGTRYELVGERDELVRPVRQPLLALTVAVGFVLLIACVNVANLVFARTTARQREIAIRSALGAGRGRVVRLLLTESCVLACLGGIAGVAVAAGGVRLLQLLATTIPRVDLNIDSRLPRLEQIGLDVPVLTFTLVLSMLTAVLCGLAPAVRSAHSGRAENLRESAGLAPSAASLSRRGRARGLLVVAEVAMAIVLLAGGALVIRSFVNLVRVDRGYDATDVMTFQVSLPPEHYPVDVQKEFAERLVTELRAVPGIDLAGYANQLPMVQLRDTGGFRRTPAVPAVRPAGQGVDARFVSYDYLRVMGIRLIAGRMLGERDGAGAPRVALINRALARTEFADADPLGQQVFLGRDATPWHIVGIVNDVRQFDPAQDAEPQLFADLRQVPTNLVTFPAGAYFAVRTNGSAEVLSNVNRIVRGLDSRASVYNAAPMEELVSSRMAGPRLYAVLLGLFGGVAVVLASIGVYGLLAFTVALRTREIGVRMALGARRAAIVRLVLGQTLTLTLAGVVLGLTGAGFLTRYLEGLLFGVSALDPVTFLGVIALFVSVAALAAAVPTSRAVGVSPLTALRSE